MRLQTNKKAASSIKESAAINYKYVMKNLREHKGLHSFFLSFFLKFALLAKVYLDCDSGCASKRFTKHDSYRESIEIVVLLHYRHQSGLRGVEIALL